MAKTITTTHTRSIDEIVEEFALVTDSGTLRFHQSRLAYEFVGSTEGAEAAELRETFRKHANEALLRHHEPILSDPGVTNLVNTWKYLLRANVETSLEANPAVADIAKAAFNLASQTFRKKDENYVNPAIEAISTGADPVSTFNKQTAALKKDKKADAEKKAADRKIKEAEADKEITYDSLVAMLKTLSPENVAEYNNEQKSILRDLLATAATLVA
ncbi:MAG: hypothetical protein EHJ95_06865 [Methanobacteriota archaeon]|nr:MAG: hypothetical protein EHJ95_06865 [Euryarchaeota archaeon]